MKGRIKTLITEKGFGFIQPDITGPDVFFHTVNLDGMQFEDLQVGFRVTFTTTEGPQGPRAENVVCSGQGGGRLNLYRDAVP
jgi:CspA family cold shock protein